MKQSTPDMQKRFPINRWQHLPILMASGFAIAAKNIGVTPHILIASRFGGAYMMGYPHYVDMLDSQYGAAIRKLLFISFYGDYSQITINRLSELREREDRSVIRGWGCGVPDGERYFKALESASDAEESLDSLIDFSRAKMIDAQKPIF